MDPTHRSETLPLQVLLVVASVRRKRAADALLPWVRRELAARSDFAVDVLDLAAVADDLPETDLVPGRSSPVGHRLDAADAFVMLVPEYNHSFPASVKNFIDWHGGGWAGKPMTFVSYGAGSGGLRAVEQLRLVLPELKAMTTRNVVAISAPWEHLGEGGLVPTERHAGAMKATLDELSWWAQALREGRRTRGAP